MNFPNILTVFRVVLTIVFIGLMLKGGLAGIIWAVIVFTAASVSDYFDGYYARKHDLVSEFGKLMDPIADKFLVLSAFFLFYVYELFPYWMFCVIFVREFLITGIRLIRMKRGGVIPAEKLGKYKTVSQIAAVYLIFVVLIFRFLEQDIFAVRLIADVAIWTAVVLTLVSGITFFVRLRESHAVR